MAKMVEILATKLPRLANAWGEEYQDKAKKPRYQNSHTPGDTKRWGPFITPTPYSGDLPCIALKHSATFDPSSFPSSSFPSSPTLVMA